MRLYSNNFFLCSDEEKKNMGHKKMHFVYKKLERQLTRKKSQISFPDTGKAHVKSRKKKKKNLKKKKQKKNRKGKRKEINQRKRT